MEIHACDAFKQMGSSKLLPKDDYSSLIRNSLSDCWAHSERLKLIRSYLQLSVNEPCQSCNKLNNCQTGCLAQKLIAYGNFSHSADPGCIFK